MKVNVIRKDGDTWEECTEYEKAQALGGCQDKQTGSLNYRMGKVCMILGIIISIYFGLLSIVPGSQLLRPLEFLKWEEQWSIFVTIFGLLSSVPENHKWVSGYSNKPLSSTTEFMLLRWLLVPQTVKNLPAIWETQVQSLVWEDPLKKGMATHSSILAWRIPWTEEPVGYSLWGCKELDMTEQISDWATKDGDGHQENQS